MDKIVVLDFGGQYAHLIANRIRRLGVYSEIMDGETPANQLKDYKGIILSGGPASVRAEDSVKCNPQIFDLGLPILAICYGHQLTAHFLKGNVGKGNVREYGPAEIHFSEKEGVFEGLNDAENVWMSHFDQVTEVPKGFKIVGSSDDCKIAAMSNQQKKIYGVQFHPEVTHTKNGMKILENFVMICGAKREWSIDGYIEDISAEIKERAANKKVFLMISGGVDSTVAFLLLDKALGQSNVYGLFVDIGFMRKNERREVEQALKEIGVENLHVYDASEEYFEALKDVYDPEKKREIIGNLFLDIQEKVSNDLNLNPDEWLLGQGTIYPDTIETGGTKHSDKIKTHHNRVEKIQKLIDEGKVIEPIAQLYKDEVRLVGERLNLKEEMVWRHPFPGPGLAVRCLCAEKEDSPAGLEEIESKMNDLSAVYNLQARVLPIKSVGVQGDERSYRHPAVVFGENHSWEDLNKLSTKLTNQFDEINRVVFALKSPDFSGMNVKKGYLTRERIALLQEADKIVMDFIVEMEINREIWQFPTVLIPTDFGEGESLVLRPVCSEEAMTANFYRMDFDKLSQLTKRLSSIQGIGGVFYDITNKPPGTIEWE